MANKKGKKILQAIRTIRKGVQKKKGLLTPILIKTCFKRIWIMYTNGVFAIK